MRTPVIACLLLVALSANALADTLEETKKAVMDSYAKIDKGVFWYCAMLADEGRYRCATEKLIYQFDLTSKRLVIALDGPKEPSPLLLANDKRAYLYLWHDGDAPVYLRIEKDRAISWADIDEAARLIQKECGRYIGCWLGKSLGDVTLGVAAPMLEGGGDMIFSQNARMLDYDPEQMAADPEKTIKELLKAKKVTESQVGIFEFGHPDTKFLQNPTEDSPKLEAQKYPLCFETKRDGSYDTYAVDRQLGTFTATLGIVENEYVYGFPGNKLIFMVKGTRLDASEYQPDLFKLPDGAATIEGDELKSSFLTAMSKIDPKELLIPFKSAEDGLQRAMKEEKEMEAELARQSADPNTEEETLENTRKELELKRGNRLLAENLLAMQRRLVEDLEKRKKIAE